MAQGEASRVWEAPGQLVVVTVAHGAFPRACALDSKHYPLLLCPFQGIDTQKAGLLAPLLVRNQETGQILVNLDRDVMTLIREAKYLQQMEVAVPKSARLVLLQVRLSMGC
jgi:hypothetical protein